MQPVPEGRADAISGVPQAVDMANLVPVKSRNRHLSDPQPGIVELQNDLRIEVPLVGVEKERNLTQRGHPEGPVAGMKFRKLLTRNPVLNPSQDAVADKLV